MFVYRFYVLSERGFYPKELLDMILVTKQRTPNCLRSFAHILLICCVLQEVVMALSSWGSHHYNFSDTFMVMSSFMTSLELNENILFSR